MTGCASHTDAVYKSSARLCAEDCKDYRMFMFGVNSQSCKGNTGCKCRCVTDDCIPQEKDWPYNVYEII